VGISLDEEILGKVIPKMTLQQVVENSVKHGFHDTDVDMEISLTGEVDEEGWRIYVRDNGSGVEEEQLRRIQERLESIHQSFLRGSVRTEAQIGGMGLANVYARCLLLYNQALVFDIRNRPEGNGTQVCIGFREMKGERIFT
jgi:sensor histidine kinase YesM